MGALIFTISPNFTKKLRKFRPHEIVDVIAHPVGWKKKAPAAFQLPGAPSKAKSGTEAVLSNFDTVVMAILSLRLVEAVISSIVRAFRRLKSQDAGG